MITNEGLPNLSLIIVISLKFKLFLNPVPKALAKASFAANLLAKYEVLELLFFLDSFFHLEILLTNNLFFNNLFILLLLIISTKLLIKKR